MSRQSPQVPPFHPIERRISVILASIMSLRLLGLFLVLPVLSLYVDKYAGASIAAMGWVMGIYGLTQGLFQIPMGMLSDKIGRKPVIMGGLCLFAFGSCVAAAATTVEGLMIGRALQGAGAVGSVILACLSDLTRQVVRAKAMAVVGVTIGLSFSLAMVLGPFLEPIIGLSGLFAVTGITACIGLIVCYVWVPSPVCNTRRIERASLIQVLRSGTLWRLNLSIFCSHAVFSASFLMIPKLLLSRLEWASSDVWQIYLPVLICSTMLMMPFLRRTADPSRMRNILMGSVAGWLLCILGLWLLSPPWLWILALIGFFACFNLLEAQLPTLVSSCAPYRVRGSALGLYSTLQFLGIFFGGVMGGTLLSRFGPQGMVVGIVCLLVVYLLFLKSLTLPVYVVDRMLAFQASSPEGCEAVRQDLIQSPGVLDVSWIPNEHIFYLRLSSPDLFENHLNSLEKAWRQQWPEVSIKLF